MPTTLLTLAEELAPYVVAIISVFGVVFTAYHERASQLKAAYFQKMSDAYEQYFDALVRYVYNDPPTGGTSLVVATHTAALYASAEISHHLQLLTKMALSYRQSGTPDIHELTGYLADLSPPGCRLFCLSTRAASGFLAGNPISRTRIGTSGSGRKNIFIIP